MNTQIDSMLIEYLIPRQYHNKLHGVAGRLDEELYFPIRMKLQTLKAVFLYE